MFGNRGKSETGGIIIASEGMDAPGSTEVIL